MSTPPPQRTVLVTGAARRLGSAFSLAFARAGWNVACHYQQSRDEALRTCSEVEALGRQAWAIAGDLADTRAIERAFAELTQAALLQRQMQVNLLAPLQLGTLLARAASHPAAGQPVPVVLHVLDQKVFNLNPDYFSYTLSKLALERAVALQAQALAPRVRVNGIAPGLVYVSGPQTGDNFERARSVNLMRSPIDPDDVARTAVFLAENDSITGITVAVDKGQHLVPLERDIMFVAEQLAPPVNP
jgi:NAD(P)-dependent dehydrogenase (short-subunit alcohol dehydrogenase family)